MSATTSCSLQFDTTFAEYALLDAAGELLEAGKLRMTKPALWNRFAALAASVVSVNYDPRFLWAVEMLTQMDHTVVFSGNVPAMLLDELGPVVGAVQGTALLCQAAAKSASPAIFFLVEAAGGRVLDAHYMVGPVTAQTTLTSLADTIPQAAEPESAQECACRLHQLVASGMLAVPQPGLRKAAVAAA